MEVNSEAAVFLSFPSVEALIGSDEPMRTCLALLGQLEASLHGSRQALLARDLAGIEQGTREQRVLAGEIETVLRKGIVPSGSELDEELRQSGSRVLAAGRLQAALLARAQRQLRVLVNMLTDPSANYGPMPTPDDAIASSRIFGWKPDWKRKRAGEI
jgi:hypothetical protein